MKILFIDPASEPEDRGFALYDGPRLVEAGTTFHRGCADWAVVEDQWVNHKASRQSLMTLSQYAGFLLGRSGASRFFAYPVKDWKNRILPGFANAPKRMFSASLEGLYPEHASLGHNVLDALAMGEAWVKASYTERMIQKWELR